MTRVIFLGAIWAAIVPLASAQKPDSAAELKAMAGKWKVEKAEYIGKDVLGLYDGLTIEITEDGKYTIALGKLKDVARIGLDPSKKPAEMDITGTAGPNKDKTIKAIYKLDGDNLTICTDQTGGNRPSLFETKEKSGNMLFVYKRAKK